MKLEAERSATADPGPVLLSVADLVEWQDAAVMEWHADPDGTEARLEERGWPAGPTAFGLGTAIGSALAPAFSSSARRRSSSSAAAPNE